MIGPALLRPLLGGLKRSGGQAGARNDQTQRGSVYGPRQWLHVLRRRHVYVPAL
ncbi:hypothetical protein D3C73_966300 [compost metagenome]